jgi:hypothetical protein
LLLLLLLLLVPVHAFRHLLLLQHSAYRHAALHLLELWHWPLGLCMLLLAVELLLLLLLLLRVLLLVLLQGPADCMADDGLKLCRKLSWHTAHACLTGCLLQRRLLLLLLLLLCSHLHMALHLLLLEWLLYKCLGGGDPGLCLLQWRLLLLLLRRCLATGAAALHRLLLQCSRRALHLLQRLLPQLLHLLLLHLLLLVWLLYR